MRFGWQAVKGCSPSNAEVFASFGKSDTRCIPLLMLGRPQVLEGFAVREFPGKLFELLVGAET